MSGVCTNTSVIFKQNVHRSKNMLVLLRTIVCFGLLLWSDVLFAEGSSLRGKSISISSDKHHGRAHHELAFEHKVANYAFHSSRTIPQKMFDKFVERVETEDGESCYSTEAHVEKGLRLFGAILKESMRFPIVGVGAFEL